MGDLLRHPHPVVIGNCEWLRRCQQAPAEIGPLVTPAKEQHWPSEPRAGAKRGASARLVARPARQPQNPGAASDQPKPQGKAKAGPPPRKTTADPEVIANLWSLARSLGHRGTFHEEIQASLAHLEDYKAAWEKRFAQCDATGMRSRWGQWSSWSTWRAGKEADPQSPNPGLLAGWLLAKEAGGPTAAAQAYYGLLWVAKHSGLQLPTSGVLTAFKKAALATRHSR